MAKMISFFLELAMLVTTPCYAAYSIQEPGSGVSKHDEAGTFVITNADVLTGKDRQKDAEIRNFLWQHWHQHQSGRLVEKRFSKEGVPATTTFVFAFDEKGVWSLTVFRQWPPQRGSTPEHDRVQYRVYVVRRIGPHHKAIPEHDAVPGDAYQLVFFNEKAEETGGL